MAMLHQHDVIILLSWPATQESKHATEDPCKNCVCSTLIGLPDRWNRVQVETDTDNCATRGMQEAVLASEKHVHVSVANQPRGISNMFTKAVLLNGRRRESHT